MLEVEKARAIVGELSNDPPYEPEWTAMAKALLKAQQQFRPVIKSKTNPYFQSKYAPLDDLLAMAIPVLNANGLILTQTVEDGALVTRLMHEAGSVMGLGEIKLPSVGDKLSAINKQGKLVEKYCTMQDIGSAITYARRYSLEAAVGVVTEEDRDGEGGRPESKAAYTYDREEPEPEREPEPTAPPAEEPEYPLGTLTGLHAGWGYKLRFGKHKGLTFAQIQPQYAEGGIERHYVTWLKKNWQPKGYKDDDAFAEAMDGVLADLEQNRSPEPEDDVQF